MTKGRDDIPPAAVRIHRRKDGASVITVTAPLTIEFTLTVCSLYGFECHGFECHGFECHSRAPLSASR